MPALISPTVPDGLAQLLHSARVWRGRELAPAPAQSTGFARLDERLPGGGWPLGALVELVPSACGIGELGITLPALKALCAAKRPVVFISSPYIPYAPALANAGLPLELVHRIVVRDDTDARWAAEQILRDGTAGAVLLWSQAADERALRRLQLAAEAGRAIAFVYRSPRMLANASPAAVRIALAPAQGTVRASIVKVRGGQPGAISLSVTGTPH